MQPPQKPPEGHNPSVFHNVVGHGSKLRQVEGGASVGVFLSFRKESGRRKIGEKNLLLPLPRVSRGRRRPTMPFKMASFGAFFF